MTSKHIKPKVIVSEIDISEVSISGHKPIDNSDLNHLLKLATAKFGPVNKPKFYGPSISKPRWYQFWRWHLIPRYNRESKQARLEFQKDFGMPD